MVRGAQMSWVLREQALKSIINLKNEETQQTPQQKESS